MAAASVLWRRLDRAKCADEQETGEQRGKFAAE